MCGEIHGVHCVNGLVNSLKNCILNLSLIWLLCMLYFTQIMSKQSNVIDEVLAEILALEDEINSRISSKNQPLVNPDFVIVSDYMFELCNVLCWFWNKGSELSNILYLFFANHFAIWIEMKCKSFYLHISIYETRRVILERCLCIHTSTRYNTMPFQIFGVNRLRGTAT